MKKLILILTLSSLLFSCSNGGNSNSNNNNSSSGNVDYYFKIKINGVEHKVQGNTSGFGSGNMNFYNGQPNSCIANIGTTTSLGFIIADITQPNYVSGQNLQMSISIPNCHVGLNQATVYIASSPIYSAFGTNLGVNKALNWVENSGLYCFNNCQGSSYSSYTNKITLNITDMGTSTQSNTVNPSVNYLNYGSTFKGNYNGPVYFSNNTITYGTQNINYNIPMQFSMEFEAYRAN